MDQLDTPNRELEEHPWVTLKEVLECLDLDSTLLRDKCLVCPLWPLTDNNLNSSSNNSTSTLNLLLDLEVELLDQTCLLLNNLPREDDLLDPTTEHPYLLTVSHDLLKLVELQCLKFLEEFPLLALPLEPATKVPLELPKRPSTDPVLLLPF